MCEGAKQQETLLTYDREQWEFPEGFWEPGSSQLNGSLIYLYHSLHWGVCVCMDYVNVLSAGVSAQDVDG